MGEVVAFKRKKLTGFIPEDQPYRGDKAAHDFRESINALLPEIPVTNPDSGD